MNGLAEAFHLSPILLLPIIVLLVLIFLKIPHCADADCRFPLRGGFVCPISGQFSFGKPDIDVCGLCFGYGDRASGYALTRGGLMAMASTILLIILALALAGCLERTAIMTSVVSKISGILQKRFSVITASYVMSTVLGFFSADCHMAIVLTSNAMGRRFDELGIHKLCWRELSMTGRQALRRWCRGPRLAFTSAQPWALLPQNMCHIICWR